MSEIDWKKVEEYSKVLEDHERLKAEKAKLFDPKELLTKASKLRTVIDPELGVISYGTLVAEDLMEINKAKTSEEKGFLMLYKALHKAYPDIKLEDVKDFTLEDFTRLMKAIFGDQIFFPKSENGLKAAETLKE
jgi:hypothetical protein